MKQLCKDLLWIIINYLELQDLRNVFFVSKELAYISLDKQFWNCRFKLLFECCKSNCAGKFGDAFVDKYTSKQCGTFYRKKDFYYKKDTIDREMHIFINSIFGKPVHEKEKLFEKSSFYEVWKHRHKVLNFYTSLKIFKHKICVYTYPLPFYRKFVILYVYQFVQYLKEFKKGDLTKKELLCINNLWRSVLHLGKYFLNTKFKIPSPKCIVKKFSLEWMRDTNSLEGLIFEIYNDKNCYLPGCHRIYYKLLNKMKTTIGGDVSCVI